MLQIIKSILHWKTEVTLFVAPTNPKIFLSCFSAQQATNSKLVIMWIKRLYTCFSFHFLHPFIWNRHHKCKALETSSNLFWIFSPAFSKFLQMQFLCNIHRLMLAFVRKRCNIWKSKKNVHPRWCMCVVRNVWHWNLNLMAMKQSLYLATAFEFLQNKTWTHQVSVKNEILCF